jgi:glycosyltransferase involved in cell wall biosynthesis
MMGDREILIFEPAAGGHQMHYVASIAKVFAQANMGPLRLVTTAQALSHESTAEVVATGAFTSINAIAPYSVSASLRYRFYGPAARQQQDVTALARFVKAEGGSRKFRLIFFPFLDSAGIIPLALGHYPFDAISFGGGVLRPHYHLRDAGVPARRRLKDFPERFIYNKLLQNGHLKALFSIDPYFVRYCKDTRVFYTPDPAQFHGVVQAGALRSRMGISPDAVIVLVYGSIDARKGLAQLLRAAAGLGHLSKVVVLIAGRQNPQLAASLPKPELEYLRRRNALFEINQYVVPEVEHELFLDADIVWLCYGSNYGNSSGAMIRAGLAGRPMITSSYGIIYQMVSDAGAGLAVNAEDVGAIKAALQTLASDAALRASMGSNGKVAFSGHTEEAFVLPMVKQLQAVLGRS